MAALQVNVSSVARPMKLLAVVLLSGSLGLHWLALQSVAWATMLVDRVQTVSLAEALKTTFDGKNPCRICKVVQEGQSMETHPEQPATAKLDLSPPAPATGLAFIPADPKAIYPDAFAGSNRRVAPPLPPPRRA